MASSKDTFESGTFLASSFACGTFRGIGADIVADQHPPLRGITGNRLLVRGIEGMRLDVLGSEGNRVPLRGDL